MPGARTLLFLTAVAAAALTAAATSAATVFHAARATTTQTDVSANWAGYVAGAVDPAGAPASFSNVSGTWVQPAADCSSAGSTGSTASAFWVGLGGNSDTSNALEQAGTESDCAADGTASYSAWYELVPAGSVRIRIPVLPGDMISASVAVNGRKVRVQMENVTRGVTFARTLTMAAPDTSSVDWIAEAPSVCSSSADCRQTALTNFGTVSFSKASATSSGHVGTISDKAWTATAIRLEASAGGPGFGRYAAEMTAAEALPTALQGKGSAFSVKWKAGASVQAEPGYSGGGYPGGYGGGYPGGYGYSRLK